MPHRTQPVKHALHFVASRRDADILWWRVRRQEICAQRGACLCGDAQSQWVVAAGDCAAADGILVGTHAVAGGIHDVLQVDLRIRGCPPTPIQLLKGLPTLLERPERTQPRASRLTPRSWTPCLWPLISARYAPTDNRGVDAAVGVQAVPSTIMPSTQEGDHVGPDVIFTQELQRLIYRWGPVMRIGVNSLLSCRQGVSPL